MLFPHRDDVQMNMGDSKPRDNISDTWRAENRPDFSGNSLSCLQNMSGQVLVQIHKMIYVVFGNNHGMSFPDLTEIKKGHAKLVFVDNKGFGFLSDNLTEDASGWIRAHHGTISIPCKY